MFDMYIKEQALYQMAVRAMRQTKRLSCIIAYVTLVDSLPAVILRRILKAQVVWFAIDVSAHDKLNAIDSKLLIRIPYPRNMRSLTGNFYIKSGIVVTGPVVCNVRQVHVHINTFAF